ncbi:MAG: hypothetical protein V8T87_07565 [Victivallales bacterium]
MELIESARISLAKGHNRIPLREKARIGNPNLWNVHTDGKPSLYEMSLIFHKNGQPHYQITKIAGIRFPELKNRKNFLLNGNPVTFRRCEFDRIPAENELEKFCRAEGFNFTMLRDTQEALEEILTLCDRLRCRRSQTERKQQDKRSGTASVDLPVPCAERKRRAPCLP